MKGFISVAIVMTLLTGCATQEQQVKTEGTAAGAGIGALVGAGLGALVGGKQGALIGAGVGAAVGGAAGYSYATSIANRHKELEGKENDLDARIRYARSVNQDTQKYNEQLEEQINALKPKVNSLAAQVKRKEIDQQQLLKEKQALESKLAEANESQALAQKELGNLKKFRAKHGKSKELDAEISRLEKNLAQLKNNTKALAAMNQRI